MRISDWSSDVCSSDLCDIGNGEAFRPHPPYLVFYVGIEPADRIKAEGRIREHAWRAAYPFDRAASALALQPLRTIADEGASIDNFEHKAGQIGGQQQPGLRHGTCEHADQGPCADCALLPWAPPLPPCRGEG